MTETSTTETQFWLDDAVAHPRKRVEARGCPCASRLQGWFADRIIVDREARKENSSSIGKLFSSYYSPH